MWNPNCTPHNKKPLLPLKSHMPPLLPSPVLPSPVGWPSGSSLSSDSQRNLSSPNNSASVSEVSCCRNSPLLPLPLLGDRNPVHDNSSPFLLHTTNDKRPFGNRTLLETPVDVPQRHPTITCLRNSSTPQNVFLVGKRKYDAIPFISDTESESKCTNSLEERSPSASLFNDKSDNCSVDKCSADECFFSTKGNFKKADNASNKSGSPCSLMKEGSKQELLASEDSLSLLSAPESEELYETKTHTTKETFSEDGMNISLERVNEFSKRQKLNNDGKSELKSELEKGIAGFAEPIVGLDSVTEYQKKNMRDNSIRLTFRCSLCNSSMFSTNVLEHIIGTKHRLKFLRQKNCLEYNRIVNFRKTQDEMMAIAEKCAEDLEKTFGRGSVKVVFDSASEGLLSEFEADNSESESCISSSSFNIHSAAVASSPVADLNIPIMNDLQMLNNILLTAKSFQTQSKLENVIPFLSSEESANAQCEVDNDIKSKFHKEEKSTPEYPDNVHWQSEMQRQDTKEKLNQNSILPQAKEPLIPFGKSNRPLFSTHLSAVDMKSNETLSMPAYAKSPTVLCNEVQSSHLVHEISANGVLHSSSTNEESNVRLNITKLNHPYPASSSTIQSGLKLDLKQNSQVDSTAEIKKTVKSQISRSSAASTSSEFVQPSSMKHISHKSNTQQVQTKLSSPFPGLMCLTETAEDSEKALFECLAKCSIDTEKEADMVLKVMRMLAETYLNFKLRELPDNIHERKPRDPTADGNHVLRNTSLPAFC